MGSESFSHWLGTAVSTLKPTCTGRSREVLASKDLHSYRTVSWAGTVFFLVIKSVLERFGDVASWVQVGLYGWQGMLEWITFEYSLPEKVLRCFMHTWHLPIIMSHQSDPRGPRRMRIGRIAPTCSCSKSNISYVNPRWICRNPDYLHGVSHKTVINDDKWQLKQWLLPQLHNWATVTPGGGREKHHWGRGPWWKHRLGVKPTMLTSASA